MPLYPLLLTGFSDNAFQAILLHPDAWNILTQQEKQEILAKFPDDTHILDAGTPDALPNPEALRNDDNFRHDCARYCENIELGRHDEEWLSQAWAAHEKHKRGDFDAFLRDQFEEQWGIELPDDCTATNTETESEKATPESARLSGSETEEAPTPNHPSGPSSHSPRPATGGDSPRNLHNEEKTALKGHDEKAERLGPTCPNSSSSTTSPPSSPLAIKRTNGSGVSRGQKRATSTVTVRPE